MTKKSFVIFGLGEFGRSVALTMMQNGYEVLVVDRKEELVEEIADDVTRAICADATDVSVMSHLGLDAMDGAIVAIGESLEASILITMGAKDCGVPFVLAKAKTEMEEKVLRRVGADDVVFPERAMGIRIGRNLSSGNFTDIIELSPQFSMVEMKIPKKWYGKTLRELNLRHVLGLNMIGRKEGDEITVSLDPDEVMRENATYIVLGSNDSLARIKE
jgi:trk system potassium uptake protein TrkA